NHLVIVGDDDQSNYGWRGAKIENIKKFSRDFPNSITIRLEQNYRSTGAILQAANNLISHNGERLGKKLWSAGETGSPIALYSAFNELDESKFVVDQILEWVSKGYARSDIAVLYRSNMQSRVIEEQLVQAGIAYRVYGGMRFFERAEIKDALGYLRLIANPHDDSAFERVVNQPNRGIGERTLSIIRQISKENFCSLWKASFHSIENNLLSPRAKSSLEGFVQMIKQMQEYAVNMELHEITENMLQSTRLVEFYSLQKGEKARSKVENLEELVSATKNYFTDEDTENTSLQSFLSDASLEAGETQGSEQQDCVQLMTLHSAKGLEFPIVFMVGVEEGVFPHQMSADEPGRLEEERRLCYVGMTRAMEQLYVSYAELRRQYGSEQYHRISRFIQEMGSDLLVEIRKKIRVQRPLSSQFKKATVSHESGLKLGQNVRHKKFGEGTLLNLEGNGANTRVEINFKDYGIKRLVLSYANLEPF
ncbi:MAG: ATP-binding domain-containing protein, partial [Legionellales bacterium]|nr:ATP-binding domain-containing protein [Legionellales bacterium]